MLRPRDFEPLSFFLFSCGPVGNNEPRLDSRVCTRWHEILGARCWCVVDDVAADVVRGLRLLLAAASVSAVCFVVVVLCFWS